MDETVLESTREGTLEEIKKCRRKIGTLLIIYFMVILLQVVSGVGNLVVLFLDPSGDMNILGKILFAALPLLMWFYSQRPSSTGGILMLYALVMNLLLENSGYSNKNIDYALYNFENDIKKIIALSPGEEITENAVLEGISDNLEYNVFKMLDSICTNRKDIAFMLLNDMLLSGGNEYGILSAIIGQLEVLLQVKELRDMGIMPKDISKKIKVHEFRVKNAYTFVTNFSERDLRRILISAFETDYRIKSGLLAAPLALEMLIADIYRAKAKVA